MIEFTTNHKDKLTKYELVGTGTTGRMISEATAEVLYSDFIEAMSAKYPAAPLTTKAGVCRVDGNGMGIAEYVESADRIKLR